MVVDEIVGRGMMAGGVDILPLAGRKKKRKRVYYHPGTGEATCLLPADKYHEQLFLRRGFTLEPPETKAEPVMQDVEPQVEQAVVVPSKGARKRVKRGKNGKSICDVCGKSFKSLGTHKRLAHENNGG